MSHGSGVARGGGGAGANAGKQFEGRERRLPDSHDSHSHKVHIV